MAYTLKSNPNGCVCSQRRGERTCLECYRSQVVNNSWTGNTACFNAECIVLSKEVKHNDAKEVN